MEHQQLQLRKWEGYLDWRNRPALQGIHGGMLAASFVLVVEILENLAYLANASNLVMYLSEYMHLSPTKSAISVTNFMATSFLLALLGGFLADAFFTAYLIYLMSAGLEFLGLIILMIQAQSSSLKPPLNEEVHGFRSTILFIGLYVVALGVGGIKGSLPSHGAEQFDETTPQGRRLRSCFFNYFVFCLSCSGLIAVTFVVWMEDNKGWVWGFGIATIAVLVSIPVFLSGSGTYRNKIPTGSPFTAIAKVLIAATINKCMTSKAIANSTPIPSSPTQNTKQSDQTPKPSTPTPSLSWLNRAAQNQQVYAGIECTVQEVEDVKIVINILPIFACTIMLNCCLAQLSTFSVQQAATMNRKLGSLTVPPASLPVFPVVFTMILAPIYNHVIVPFARRVTKSEMGIRHLQRIGIGLILSVVAMVVAALVETKRKHVASTSADPISFFWIAFQYLFLGSADLFTLAGLLEFFFTEAPVSMRSLATSLSWASLAIGYYLSSVIVSIVNCVTDASRQGPWLSGSNINEYRLERFYWLMCVLSALNFLHYLFWSSRYKYRSTRAS